MAQQLNNVLLLDQYDLRTKIDVITRITLQDIKADHAEIVRNSELVLYNDEKGNTMILKYRYGSHGYVLAKNSDWLIGKIEIHQERYIENESFMLDYIKLPWWKKLLFGNKLIFKHVKEVNEKYK